MKSCCAAIEPVLRWRRYELEPKRIASPRREWRRAWRNAKDSCALRVAAQNVGEARACSNERRRNFAPLENAPDHVRASSFVTQRNSITRQKATDTSSRHRARTVRTDWADICR